MSSFPTVEAAIVTVLSARPNMVGVPVTLTGPNRAEDIQNDSGAFEAVWIGGARTVGLSPPVLGIPVWYDELLEIDVVFQVLKINDDADTQLAADQRVNVFWRELLGAVSADPQLGIVDADGLQIFSIEASDLEWVGGSLGADQNASRAVAKLRVHARIELT